MQIPTDKTSLSVFLRDYGGRSRKTRSEKISIMKDIIEKQKVTINGEEHELTDTEYDTICRLYRKYIIGKMTSQIEVAKVIELFNDGAGRTIRDVSSHFKCSDETVRTKLEKLVDNGVIIRGENPENKRQGLFFLKSKYIKPVEIPA